MVMPNNDINAGLSTHDFAHQRGILWYWDS